MHGARALQLNLHLWGMAINFLLSALLFAVALRYLGTMLSERERELSRLRERAARNEGILALGAHAAALAHALNTPLGSMQLILDDLELAPGDAESQEDLRTLRQLAGECRARVQSLVTQAQTIEALPVPAGEFFGEVVERWRLLRPALQLQASGLDTLRLPIRPEPLLEHLLLALLNNAADASVEVGSERIEVELALDAEALLLRVRDHGPGLDSAAARRLQVLFETTKPQGLGLGLALSHATVDHFGGSLRLRAHPQGGSVAEVRLPLAALLKSPSAEAGAAHE
jgi:two-component system sensor histidine kinase RegB